MAKDAKDTATELPVKLGGVSIKENAKISARVDRTKLNIAKAAMLFCNARCEVQIDADGALPMGGGLGTVKSVADIKRFGTDADHYTISLVFSTGEIKVNELALLAGKEAKLTITKIGEADDTPEPGDDE